MRERRDGCTFPYPAAREPSLGKAKRVNLTSERSDSAAEFEHYWIPDFQCRFEDLERAIDGGRFGEVIGLCARLRDDATGVGSPSLARVAWEIRSAFQIGDVEEAALLTKEAEHQLEAALHSVRNEKLAAQRASEAYQRVQNGDLPIVPHHGFSVTDLHRVSARFGGKLDVAYRFTADVWLPQLRDLLKRIERALGVQCRSEIADACSSIHVIASAAGLRGIASCAALIAYEAGSEHYAPASKFLHEARHEIATLTAWLDTRLARACVPVRLYKGLS
jgi:hypothetical protein